MDLRHATAEDIDDIRQVARESMTASYGHAIDDDVLTEAVEAWYDEEGLSEELEDEDTVFVVAVDDGEIVGFAQSYYVGGPDPRGDVAWLHIAPDNRGAGLGSELLSHVESELLDRGAERIEGRVLVENEMGAGFYEREGFERSDERTVDIHGEEFEEVRYTKRFAEAAEGREERLTESFETEDGTEVFVAYDEADRALYAPFYVGYLDPDRTERYGYFCGNCESFDTAMDSMGRVECNDCGNQRRPSRWDSAYL